MERGGDSRGEARPGLTVRRFEVAEGVGVLRVDAQHGVAARPYHLPVAGSDRLIGLVEQPIDLSLHPFGEHGGSRPLGALPAQHLIMTALATSCQFCTASCPLLGPVAYSSDTDQSPVACTTMAYVPVREKRREAIPW